MNGSPAQTSSAAAEREGPLYVQVAVPVPVDHPFQYRVPERLESGIELGARVRVRFGPRLLIGTVVEVGRRPLVDKVLDIVDLLDSSLALTPEVLGLCRWMADRYGAGLGEALEAALPPAVRRGGRARRTVLVSLTDAATGTERVRELVHELDERFPKQARALRILAAAGGRLRELDLRKQAQISAAPIQSLERRGLLHRECCEVEGEALAMESEERSSPPPLTQEQKDAGLALRAALRRLEFHPFLLFGVTGSGKTEVYLHALEEAVQRGRRGIALVPEISLTPQTVARFRARFPRVAVLHSALTDAERRRQWLRIRRGEVDVAVGARSAIFAPMPDLGLIIVDEEHEPSFKQQNPPRYHAREVALERARRENAVVVLGSATPSLESWQAAQTGRFSLLRLPARVGGGQLPDTVTLDLGHLPFRRVPRLLTDRLRAALRTTVEQKAQAILFLNRRGFARLAVCSACKESIRCGDCDVTLVLHQQAQRLICHLCGFEQDPPRQCPGCQKPGLRYLGFGTERVEDEVKDAVPGARVVRMDSDTTAVRGSHERILEAFGKQEIDILVGTQMIAKGLDFPHVTLVGIISADTSLLIPDYRAAERTFQLVAQVAGRAGRSARGGQVLVQTLHPDHPAIRAAVLHDFERFARAELRQRKEAGYPPFGELLRILASHPEEARARAACIKVREKLAGLGEQEGVQLLGPAPCPIARVRGRFRYQMLVKCADLQRFRRLVAFARAKVVSASPVRVTLDVDPTALL